MTCNEFISYNLFATSEPPKYSNSPNLWFDFFMLLQQTIWGALEKNISLGFRKGCVNLDRFALLWIKQKNHNKRLGEFEYFGGSDVVNKLLVSPFY